MNRNHFNYYCLICIVFLMGYLPCYSHVKRIGVGNSGTYYALINKAETFICENKKNEAINLYSEALKMVENKMPSKDLYNMFICCLDVKDYDKAYHPLKMLRKRGWSEEKFNQTIKEYYSEKEWVEIRKVFLKTITIAPVIDTKYFETIDSLVAIDQRTNLGMRAKNNGNLNQEGKDSMNTVTVSNLNYLKKYFTQQFPTDDNVGHRNADPREFCPYHVILFHNIQGKNTDILSSTLYNAVENIGLDPKYFEFIISEHSKSKGKDSTITINGKNITVPLSYRTYIGINDTLYKAPSVARVDSICDLNREKITGLNNLDLTEQKLIFEYYNKKYMFNLGLYILHIDINDATFLTGLKKRFIMLPNK